MRALARRIRKLLNAWDSDMSSKQRRDTLATAVARAQSHVSRGMLSGGGTEEAGLLRPSLTAAVSGNSRSSAVEATMDQPTLLSIRAADAMSTSGGRSYEPILSAGTGGGPPGFRSGHGWNVSATDVTINIPPPPSTSAKPLLSSAIHTTGGEHPAAISSADDLIRAAAERLLQRQRASGSSNAGSNGGGLLLASPSWSSPSAPATRVARMHREHTVGHAPAASEESSMRFIGRHPGIQRYASANVRSMAGAGATTFGAMRFTSPLAASSVKTTPSLLSSTPTPSTGKATPMSTRSGQMGVAPGYTGGGASMRGSEGSDSAHHRHAPTETDLTQSPPSTEDTARGYGMSVSTAVPTSGVHVEPLFGGNRLQKHVSDGSGGDALRRAVMLGRPPPDLYVSPQGEPLSTRSLGAVLSPAVSSTSHAITAFTSVSPSNSGYEAATSTSRNESPHYPPWSPSRTELVLRPLPHPSDEWQRPVPTKLSDMSRAGVPQNAVEEGGAQQTMVHLQHGASLSHLLPPHATMLQGQTYLTHAVQTHGEPTGQAVSASEGVVSPSCGGYVSDKDYESDSSSALSPDQYTLSSARNSGGRAAAAHFIAGAAMLPRPTASGADAAAQPSASSGTSASLQAASARGTQTDGLKTELAAEGEQRLQAPAVGEAGALIKSASFTVGGNVSDEMHGIIPGSQHPSRPDDSYVYDYAFEHEYRRKRQGVAGFSHLPIAKMPAHHHPTAASTFVEEPKPLSHALGLTRKLAPVTINGRATDASTVLVLGWKPQETADAPAPTGVAGPQPPPPDKSDSTQPSDRHVSTSSSSAVTISAGAPEIILPAGASSTSGGDGTKRGFGDGAVSGKAGAQPFATAATSVSTTFMAAAGASGGGMHAGGTTVSPFSRGGSCVSPSAEGETPQSMRAEHMAAAAGGPKRAPSHPPLNLHVLVVDDEEVNRKIAARFLKRLGCTYTLIDDGDRVVEALLTDTRNFDVILMDILMQRTNGLEVCKSLRDQQVEIPIIAVTAAFSRREQAIYQLAGFDDVLPKPFSIDDLYHSMILARRIQRQRGVAPLSSADM
ncbi:response regulator [archaeon]|nr:MAG: response regulator [archaeon]